MKLANQEKPHRQLHVLASKLVRPYRQDDVENKWSVAGMIYDDGTIGRISKLTGKLGLHPYIEIDWFDIPAKQSVVWCSSHRREFTQQFIHMQGNNALWLGMNRYLEVGEVPQALYLGMAAVTQEMTRQHEFSLSVVETMTAHEVRALHKRVENAQLIEMY